MRTAVHEPLKKLMKEQRYSCAALAVKAEMKPTTLHTKINGKSAFTIWEAKKIADVLGIKGNEITKYFLD